MFSPEYKERECVDAWVHSLEYSDIRILEMQVSASCVDRRWLIALPMVLIQYYKGTKITSISCGFIP